VNIKIESLTGPQNSRKYQYQDLAIDLEFNVNKRVTSNDKQNTDVKVSYDYDAIKNSLRNIFNTSRGEKVLNPLFGASLVQYLFEPVTEETARRIGDDIVRSIQLFEPRVNLDKLNIDLKAEQNEYEVTLNITIPALKMSTILKGSLSNNGFNYIP